MGRKPAIFIKTKGIHWFLSGQLYQTGLNLAQHEPLECHQKNMSPYKLECHMVPWEVPQPCQARWIPQLKIVSDEKQ